MEIFTAENVVAFLTLAALETVLGIDNVIFLSILSNKLPSGQQTRARQIGIGLAVGARVALLLVISAVIALGKNELFSIFGNGLTGKDIILLVGGLFLIGKSTFEIHEKLEAVEHEPGAVRAGRVTMASVLTQIVLIDLVFSLDSVITAVGITSVLPIMIAAILVAAVVMLVFAENISRFVEKHPTMKMLALAFLILIGSLLVIEGWAHEVVEEFNLKNYIYFAMAFSFGVELMNIRLRKPSEEPVRLHNRPKLPEAPGSTST